MRAIKVFFIALFCILGVMAVLIGLAHLIMYGQHALVDLFQFLPETLFGLSRPLYTFLIFVAVILSVGAAAAWTDDKEPEPLIWR